MRPGRVGLGRTHVNTQVGGVSVEGMNPSLLCPRANLPFPPPPQSVCLSPSCTRTCAISPVPAATTQTDASVSPATKTVWSVMAPQQMTVTSVLSHPRFSMMDAAWRSVRQGLTMRKRPRRAEVKTSGGVAKRCTPGEPDSAVGFCRGQALGCAGFRPQSHHPSRFLPAPEAAFESALIYYVFLLNESFTSFDHVNSS